MFLLNLWESSSFVSFTDFDVHLKSPDDHDVLLRLSNRVKKLKLDFFIINEIVFELGKNDESVTEYLKLSFSIDER